MLRRVAELNLAQQNPAYYEADWILYNPWSGVKLDVALSQSWLTDYVYRRAVAAQWDVGL